MKFCNKCGTQNSDTSKFCVKCGNQMEAAQATPQQQVYTPQTQQPTYQQQQHFQPKQGYYAPKPKTPKGPLSSHPVLNKLKIMSTTPLFLIATIAYSVMTFFNFINIFIVASDRSGLTQYDFTGVSSGLNALSVVFSVIGMTPVFLIVAGLWMFYVSSLKIENRSTSGLTLIKVSTIISLVCQFAIVGLVFIFSIIGMIGGSNAYDSGGAIIGSMLFLDLVVCIAMALPIIYSFATLKTVNSIKLTVLTGTVSVKSIGFLGGLNYIFAGFSFIGLIISLAMSSFISGLLNNSALSGMPSGITGPVMNAISSMFSPSVLQILSTLINIGIFVLFAVMLFTYKKEMLVLSFSNVQHTPITTIQPQQQPNTPAQMPTTPAIPTPTPVPSPQSILKPESTVAPQIFVPSVPSQEKATTPIQSVGNAATTVLASEVETEGTTLLSEEIIEKYDYLIRTSNEDKILLNKPVFRIGKEKSYVDYFVADNNAVSRSHADFITKDGKCFILDHNSTNKTFIDGMVIEPNKEILLSNGIKIKLANEEFTYFSK